jgi:thiol-disulfide isomerase/thioredoxin
MTAYDGATLMDYWTTDGKPFQTKVDDPKKGSVEFVFDPRILGIAYGPFSTETVSNCLDTGNAGSVQLVGNESVDGKDAWHVRIARNSRFKLDFWIDAHEPRHVLKFVCNTQIVESKYDSSRPDDPLPIEVALTSLDGKRKPRYETRYVRQFTQYNIPVDPASWTLAGLGMQIGTEVVDYRISRRLGYWDGSGLSENLPSRPHREIRNESPPPNPDKLLALIEKDPKSSFALNAAIWIILNTPDGPQVEQAAAVILKEHIRSTNLVQLCQELNRMHPRCAKELLQAALDKNPGPEVKAQACFALAMLLKGEANERGDEQLSKEAQKLFERVIADYGEVKLEGKPLSDAALPKLTELRLLAVGKIAPEIEGENLDGQKMKLSDFRGKVVVLTFWGTWCGSCMEMVPDERKLVSRLTGKPFALIGVNSDDNGTKLKSVLEQKKITWPSFRDGQTPGRIAAAWNVQSWPAIYVLDTKGVI